MSKYDGTTLEVVNWASYNPRTDSKKPSWFRLENNIATGPAFFGLDCEQKWLWIIILSLVSQKNGEPIVWNSNYIEAISGIKSKTQDSALEIFEQFSRLRVTRTVTSRNSHEDVRDSHATNERTNVRTNETNETNETNTGSVAAFVDIWNDACLKAPLAEVKVVSEKRKRAIKGRLNDAPDLDYWSKVVERITASAFCLGNGSTGWKADFDWLIKPDTHIRIMEGKYDDRQPPLKAKTKAERVSEINAEMFAAVDRGEL